MYTNKYWANPQDRARMRAMRESLGAWHSFLDPAVASQAAESLREEHGEGAKAAALDCALAARAERRGEDYRFWLCVLCLLQGVRLTLH